MTVHRVEELGPSKTGWGQMALVIEIDSIARDDLEAGVSRLISGIPVLMREVKKNGGRMFPVQFDVKGKARVSERSFWRILTECSERSSELVARYIDALVATSETFHHAEEYAAGANAVFSALDVILERVNSSGSSPEKLTLYDAFYRYLDKLCDLDHEVYENDYIYSVLAQLRTLDRCRYLELLCLRMFNGQYAADETPFWRLHGKFGPGSVPSDAVLKEFIDLAVSKGLYEAWHLKSVFMLLITVIYGSNEAQIADVWQYVVKSIGCPDDEQPEVLDDYLEYMKWQSDRHMSKLHRRKGWLYSGFHRYDLEDKVWQPI